ncbi:MAG: ClpX C4-type zinc finger protein [Gammaproteobacteria bacterium]
MSKEFIYDIFLNDKIISTVGPSSLKQLHISFGVSDDMPLVKASGISDKEPGLLYINWLEEVVNFDDVLKISPSKDNVISSPVLTKKLKRGMESTEEDNYCDFCKSSEDEAGSLIMLGDSPQICEKCVKLCVVAFKTDM